MTLHNESRPLTKLNNRTADRSASGHLENPAGFLDERMLPMQSSRKDQIYVSKLPISVLSVRPARSARRSSYKERRVDALALRAEERRDKLRKAAGRSKYPLIRGCLNGETRQSKPLSLCAESIGVQGEPRELKHLSTRRKRKKTRFP